MGVTPMMEQYLSFKNQYPDKVVLFRMGDFFETFGEDAKVTSKVLNITLTARDRNSDPTPLAGFPHHALNQYLPKFIDAGLCVVIVDQIEDPKLAKGIVKRAVTRIVTPSTLDSNEVSSSRKNFLGSFFKNRKDIYIALLEVTTGEFVYTQIADNKSSLSNFLAAYNPSEAIIVESEKGLVFPNIPVQLQSKAFSNLAYAQEILKEFFKVNSVDSLGVESEDFASIVLAMAVTYVKETQKIDPVHIKKPIRVNMSKNMVLDRATINNLEIIRSSYNGSNEGSLVSVIDGSKTLMGRRLLYSWILSPLTDIEAINARLNIVNYFYTNSDILEKTRDVLSEINDIERLVGKIGLNRLTARDLKALEISLDRAIVLSSYISEIKESFPILFSEEVKKKILEIIELINKNIEENPPLSITEGHIIKLGANSEVDELRSLTGDSKGWIKKFEEQEKSRTGISSLKIGFTKVFGYYIEITNTHKEKVPADYIRKQTLVNAERYITEELKEKEDLILNSQERLAALEYKLFVDIRNKILPSLSTVQDIATQIANIDVLSGFAYIAKQRNYCKPTVIDFGGKNGVLKIEGGRHPVVEAISNEEFVTNNTLLDMKANRMGILTGPNMSGKSTYIRQVAVISLMCQIGCFVPANKCEISLVDRIFTRVGASDDLSRGRSTFMVEMDEAANIVNSATKYSLVILDEIGRGTSTYDGVSIAWALAEYLTMEVKCRTLFATHYHELLKLSQKISDGVKNYSVLVEEDLEKGIVIFLRKIVEGGTDRSYGIYVAKMAGLPQKVVARAQEILEGFEQESLFSMDSKIRDTNIPSVDYESKRSKRDSLQIPLFKIVEEGDEIKQVLKDINIENLTPIEALNLLADLKKKSEA